MFIVNPKLLFLGVAREIASCTEFAPKIALKKLGINGENKLQCLQRESKRGECTK
jgi:hypothetical protein